jgi:hypothetical protein
VSLEHDTNSFPISGRASSQGRRFSCCYRAAARVYRLQCARSLALQAQSPVISRQHPQAFSYEAWNARRRVVLWLGCDSTPNREGVHVVYLHDPSRANGWLPRASIIRRSLTIMAGVLPSPAPLRRFTVRHPRHLRHLPIIGAGKQGDRVISRVTSVTSGCFGSCGLPVGHRQGRSGEQHVLTGVLTSKLALPTAASASVGGPDATQSTGFSWTILECGRSRKRPILGDQCALAF